MGFFMSSITLVDQAGGGDSDLDLEWETKLNLLEIVDREMLFSTSGQTDAAEVLRRTGHDAIETLGCSQSMCNWGME